MALHIPLQSAIRPYLALFFSYLDDHFYLDGLIVWQDVYADSGASVFAAGSKPLNKQFGKAVHYLGLAAEIVRAVYETEHLHDTIDSVKRT